MPAKKVPHRARLELRAGPLGAEFFDRVAASAQKAGETLSEYVRRAVQLRMDGEADMVRTSRNCLISARDPTGSGR